MITSLDNERIKDLVKLQKKKYRDSTNTFLLEGEHSIREAYKEDILKELFVLDGEDVSYDVPITYVSRDVMRKISTMPSIPNMIGVCFKRDSNKIIGDKVLLLDDVQDPGNLGTIIRSSVAFNISTIILSLNSVDLYNPKVLRATQGIFLHTNIVRLDSSEAIKYLKSNGYSVYGTDVVNGVDVRCLNKEEKNKFCLVMGNEGNGLKSEIDNLCDKNLYIKMSEKAESLNVGVACSILLYELDRK